MIANHIDFIVSHYRVSISELSLMTTQCRLELIGSRSTFEKPSGSMGDAEGLNEQVEIACQARRYDDCWSDKDQNNDLIDIAQ